MKILVLAFLIPFLVFSCTAYKVYVPVQNQTNIPDGTQSITLTANPDSIKKAFISNGVMIRSSEGGFETEELLLDEGTRAMYKIHTYDNATKITAFWGITAKVKNQMSLATSVIAGYDASHSIVSNYDVHAWDQVVYDKTETRPKMVFDYLVQLIEKSHLSFSLYPSIPKSVPSNSKPIKKKSDENDDLYYTP
jgi:hypothetical protein